MLDIKFIRENPETIKKAAKNKGVEVDIDRLLEVDRRRREIIKLIDGFRFQKNEANREIKKSTEKGKKEIIEKMRKTGVKENNLNRELKDIDNEFQYLMKSIPNPALENVPVGKDDSQNVVLRKVGEKPNFDFKPKDYLSLAEDLDLVDVKRAAKVSGSRFGYLKREAALMEFALVQLALNLAVKKNFIPVVPPAMIKPEMMERMGYIKKPLNKKREWEGDEVYFLKDDNLLLVGTSEQSIGPMHADEVFEKKELPKRYIGFSSCFRREAGSYGKDTKGILRVHQFDKIEMFSFVLPEKSEEEHNLLLGIGEELMQLLGISYQVVDICTGDLGDPAARKYDIEAWMPGQKEYRETHSTSNCTDFQSRRLNVRYKNNENQSDFVHTLNGTALPIGRILIAIIENYQKKDGSIGIPDILAGYVGKKEIKGR